MNFKFGVLYAKAGQRADDDMYCNGKYVSHVMYIVRTCTWHKCKSTLG